MSMRCYPVVPLSGERIPRADTEGDEAMSLKEIVLLLNDAEYQEEGLSALGFVLSSDGGSVTIRFKERGKAYADPTGDRTKTEEEPTTRFFETSFALPAKVKRPLPVRISLGGWYQDGVNFLGNVEASGGYVLPLTGRGTAALEGRSGDAHAGFCTGGACAAFQERVSMLLAFAVAAGARANDLRSMVEGFRPINARYHGREAILDYTLHCALLPAESAGSYRSFILMGNYLIDDVMKPLVQGAGTPEEAYFAKLEQKFSSEELSCAEQLKDTSQPVRSSPPFAFYPVCPLPGNPLLLADKQSKMSLTDMAAMLSDPARQDQAVQKLGFSVTAGQTSIAFEFLERGKAYLEPLGDRCLIEAGESEKNFTKRLSLMEPLASAKPQLPITVEVKAWLQDNVNFLGKVTVAPPGERVVVVPLTGRGTIALEGKTGDAHAGFCTGGACAAFQNRVALCLSVARSFGVHDDHLESLAEKFRDSNATYHGRDDILDYTLYCALGKPEKTYLAFMKDRYPSHIGRPPVLTSIMTVGRPPVEYFDKLALKFSADELETERQRHVMAVDVEPAPKDVPDANDVPDAKDVRDVPDVKDVRDVPDVKDVPDVPDVKDVRDVPDERDVRDTRDVRDEPKVFDMDEKTKKEKRSDKHLTVAVVVASCCIGAVCIIVFFTLRNKT